MQFAERVRKAGSGGWQQMPKQECMDDKAAKAEVAKMLPRGPKRKHYVYATAPISEAICREISHIPCCICVNFLVCGIGSLNHGHVTDDFFCRCCGCLSCGNNVCVRCTYCCTKRCVGGSETRTEGIEECRKIVHRRLGVRYENNEDYENGRINGCVWDCCPIKESNDKFLPYIPLTVSHLEGEGPPDKNTVAILERPPRYGQLRSEIARTEIRLGATPEEVFTAIMDAILLQSVFPEAADLVEFNSEKLVLYIGRDSKFVMPSRISEDPTRFPILHLLPPAEVLVSLSITDDVSFKAVTCYNITGVELAHLNVPLDVPAAHFREKIAQAMSEQSGTRGTTWSSHSIKVIMPDGALLSMKDPVRPPW